MPRAADKFSFLEEFHIFRASDMTPEAVAARQQSAGDGVKPAAPIPLYSGRATSRNEFIKSLVESGASMAGADLHGVVLSGCRIEGVDFRGANLTNARLNGVRAANCDFSGAKLSRTTMGGADLRLAKFVGASIVHSDFDKSTLTGAEFASAEISDSDFFKVNGANIDFKFAYLQRAAFDRASLSQADFRGARISGVSFKKADLRSHADRDRERENGKPNMPRRRARDIRDLTFGTIAAGCSYDEAKLSEDHPALLRDKSNAKIGKIISWLTTSAIVGAGIGIPLDSMGLAEMAIDAVGVAGASIVAVPLVKIATDAVVDAIKEKFEDAQENAIDRIRHTLETARIFFKHKKDTILAFVNARKAPTIVNALRATQRPGEKLGFFDVVGSRDIHLIVADAKNFNAAFHHLVLREETGRSYHDDVSIMLAQDVGDVPRMMRFFKDGSSAAVWYEGGYPAFAVTFAKDGSVDEDMTVLPDNIERPTREAVFKMFQEAVLMGSGKNLPLVAGRRMRLDIDKNGNPIRVPERSSGVEIAPPSPRTENMSITDFTNIEPDENVVAMRPGR